jgi:lipopolysaccharide transport system permease protein
MRPMHSIQGTLAAGFRDVADRTLRIPMFDRVREIYAYRELLSTLIVRDLKLRYKNSVLGFLWSLVNPMLLMLVFTIVFTVMIPNLAVPKFPVFVMAAVLPWNFFNTAVMSSIQSVSTSGHLIKKVYFPLEVLPLSVVLSNFVNFLLAFIVLFAMILLFRVPITAAIFYLPLIMVVHVSFTAGVSFVLGTLNVFYRDTGVIMEVLMQAWFFLTPVFYPLEMLPESALVMGAELPVRRLLYILNPMASIIASYRSVLYGSTVGTPPHAPAWDFMLRTAVTSLLMLALGMWVFARYRNRFAEEV